MSSFDKAAATYDSSFTFSKIGISQRKRVWSYLDKILNRDKKLSILELNCGTGEDALYFAKRGHYVIATDLSTSMLEMVKNKIPDELKKHIKTQFLDLLKPIIDEESTFDLIFSNFGGLNCLSFEEMEQIAQFIEQRLNKYGDFVAIIMPENTSLEKLFRIKKGNINEFQKRNSKKPLYVNVNGTSVATYYYNQESMKSIFSRMKVIETRAVGFIPSYLEKSKFLPIFRLLDFGSLLFNLNPNKADHYLIHFKKTI